MTIRMPDIRLGDRLLKALGKKRGVRLPAELYEKYGPYVFAVAQKESFWKALARPKDTRLPVGYVDLFSFERDAQEQEPRSK
jgi:hypothetical protein